MNSIPKPTAIIRRASFVTLNAMICAVSVVPMLAPNMIPTAWDTDSMPAVMNPTVNTVVTDEDCMTAVTIAPVRAPI